MNAHIEPRQLNDPEYDIDSLREPDRHIDFWDWMIIKGYAVRPGMMVSNHYCEVVFGRLTVIGYMIQYIIEKGDECRLEYTYDTERLFEYLVMKIEKIYDGEHNG